MFANEEGMQSVDVKALFTRMVGDLPWDALKGYIIQNADLSKRCTMGGFRLDPKFRPRMQEIVIREAEKNGFSDISYNGVFTVWYPTHKTLHRNLEDYFASEEYKQHRAEQGLGDDVYVLTDEKFRQFFEVKEVMCWKILLCFSPLRFTEEQAKSILEDKKNDVELVERLAGLEKENGELSRKVEQLQQEAERLRARQQTDAQEIQNLKKENRQGKLDCEQYQKRAESALAEMRRANERLAMTEAKVTQHDEELRLEQERIQGRAQASIDAAKSEMVLWRTRHEQQCQENHALEEQARAANERCAQAQAACEDAVKKLESSHNLIDSLLGRIDWKRIVGLKASPAMTRNLRSLMQNLTYDSGRNLTLDTSLPIFWTRLCECEKQLILAIAKSSDRELASGSIKEYWAGLESQFAMVQNSIEAREALLGMMKEIFYQTYTEDELKENAPLADEEPEEKKPVEKKPAEKKPVKRKAAAKADAAAPREKKTPAKKAAAKDDAEKAAPAKKPATKKSTAKRAAGEKNKEKD